MLPRNTFCWCCWAGWLSRISVVKPERSGCRVSVFSISPPAELFALLQIPLIPLTLPGQQPCGQMSSRPPLSTSDCRGVWGRGLGVDVVRTPSKSHLSLKATPKMSAVCPALHREGRHRRKRRTDVSAESLCSEYLLGIRREASALVR